MLLTQEAGPGAPVCSSAHPPSAIRHALARALLRDFHHHFPDDPARERDVYYRADEKRYQEVLHRLLGHTSESAPKLA